MRRIKICEKKHDIDEVEEFNVNKKEDQKLYAVVNIEDIFIQLTRFLNATFFATQSSLDENLQLTLFKIYKHILNEKRKEILEKKIQHKYFDCFYTDPYIRYKSVQLEENVKIPDVDYTKFNKLVRKG
jgi:hypothetical protein